MWAGTFTPALRWDTWGPEGKFGCSGPSLAPSTASLWPVVEKPQPRMQLPGTHIPGVTQALVFWDRGQLHHPFLCFFYFLNFKLKTDSKIPWLILELFLSEFLCLRFPLSGRFSLFIPPIGWKIKVIFSLLFSECLSITSSSRFIKSISLISLMLIWC